MSSDINDVEVKNKLMDKMLDIMMNVFDDNFIKECISCHKPMMKILEVCPKCGKKNPLTGDERKKLNDYYEKKGE